MADREEASHLDSNVLLQSSLEVHDEKQEMQVSLALDYIPLSNEEENKEEKSSTEGLTASLNEAPLDSNVVDPPISSDFGENENDHETDEDLLIEKEEKEIRQIGVPEEYKQKKDGGLDVKIDTEPTKEAVEFDFEPIEDTKGGSMICTTNIEMDTQEAGSSKVEDESAKVEAGPSKMEDEPAKVEAGPCKMEDEPAKVEDEHESADDDDDDDDEDDEGNKEEIMDTAPYSYTRRENEFTSEIFKIEISNLPKKSGYKQFKRMIENKLKFKPVKVKLMPRATHAFVTFRDERERKIALKLLCGHKWKGRYLHTKPARALPDPVEQQRAKGMARKRFIEEAANCNLDAKRTKVDLDNEGEQLAIAVRLNHSVTPLWDQPYSAQVEIKNKYIIEMLKKLTRKLTNAIDLKGSWVVEESVKRDGVCCELLPCVESPTVDGYRNKCEFTIAEGPDGEKTVGFRLGSYREGYSGVVEPSQCIHVSDVAKKVAATFQKYIRQCALPVYDLCFHTGYWQTLTVRTTVFGESMAIIQFSPQKMTQKEIEIQKDSITKFFSEGEGKECNLTSLYAQVNPTRLYMKSSVELSSGSRRMHFSRRFGLLFLFGYDKGQQIEQRPILGQRFIDTSNPIVNTKGAEKMFEIIKSWLGDCSEATLLDICCGTGSIGLCLAQYVKKVIGVELIQSAVEDAQQNALTNGIKNAHYVCGKVEDVFVEKVLKRLPRKIEVIGLIDPPRAGIHATVIQGLRKCHKIDKLIYVSCNPNAAINNFLDLCRPTSKRLRTAPFRLVKAIPVDLFPHTKHCELVMMFQRDTTYIDAANYYKYFY